MGHFSEETLRKFNEMCAARIDFGESPVYDFARCLTSGGKVYGISEDEQCKVGRKVADKEEKESSGKSDSRMSKLKQAFIRKMGREMTPKEIAKAQNMLGVGVPIPKGKSAEDVLQQLIPRGEKVMPVRSA
jgi:hypothetical protein